MVPPAGHRVRRAPTDPADALTRPSPAQLIPVTLSAVVQLFLMALRAEASVIFPAHTAFFSFVSTPSLFVAVGLP